MSLSHDQEVEEWHPRYGYMIFPSDIFAKYIAYCYLIKNARLPYLVVRRRISI
jgi:hypothetical protein